MTEYEAMRDSGVEWIGAIPAAWHIERIKDVIPSILGGATPSSSNGDFWDEGDISWITPTDFQKYKNIDVIDNSIRKITFAGLQSCSSTLLPPGTVIMASRATIGIAKISGIELCTNQGFISFVCNRGINNKFFFYCINAYLGHLFEGISAGTTFKEISRNTVKQQHIAFPSLNIQQTIARQLDERCGKLDAIIAIKQQQIKTLDSLQRNIISETVTRGVQSCELKETGNVWMSEIPEHWKLVNLKRVSKIQTGFTLGKQYEGTLIERPYLRVANVQDGHLNLTDLTTIEVPVYVASRVELRAGDVLMTEGGDLDKLGRGTVWNEEIPNCLHQNHVFAVRCFQHKLLPAFLAYMTTSRYGRDYFEVTGKRTTNLASTNSTKVGQFPIPLPPLNEQKGICDYLENKLSVIAKTAAGIEAQIATLEAYKKSLIYECVTGKKRIALDYQYDEIALA